MSRSYRDVLYEGIDRLRKSGAEEPEADARVLFDDAFRIDSARYLLTEHEPAPQEGILRFKAYLWQRESGRSVQQILSRQDFMGLSFIVSEDVLVPRMDTEILVDTILHRLPASGEVHGLDLCTGSGCIAVTLMALARCRLMMDAADLSPRALSIARRNGDLLLPGTKPVWLQGDFFEAVPAGKVYDFIVCNPPYIPSGEIAGLEPQVRDHEPRIALDGGSDGLYFYRRLAEECPDHLTSGSPLYLEIGAEQGRSVSTILQSKGFTVIQVIKDLSGLDRVVTAVCP
ncbi:MAG: peptide chain release factor N(5)-glutamine methyltransferase [Firmicutes bacterium]|nr:peptide chain release factor N(5)-glutamine methyltransferase [Bacillota bacterium]